MIDSTITTQHHVLTPTGQQYMALWQEDDKLKMQLLGNIQKPIVAVDIKALPQIIERLVDIHNEVHPDQPLPAANDTIIEGADLPQSKDAGTF